MRSKNKKILSGMFSLLMVSNLLSVIPVCAMEGDTFPYMFYAASENDDAIRINAGSVCFNGGAGTKGTLKATAEDININGQLDEYTDVDISFIGNALDKTYFSNNELVCEPEDYSIEELNINVNVPMDISGNATLNGNSNINAAIKADGDISILGEVINSNSAVLYSEFGDVIIDTDNVNFSGLIYAPNGDIKIDAEYVNLNSVVIIGQTINIDCPNNVNANMNYSLARYISDASRSTEEEEPIIEEPEDDTLYAWASYEYDENSITISWEDDEYPVHNVYIKNVETELLSEVSDNTEYVFVIDPENADDEYVFVVERTDINGNTLFSNNVIIRRDTDGIYEFIDSDTDNDGLEDLTEVNLGTNRFITDSDEDGLLDKYEYYEIQTDPTEYDTDENGIGDGDEDFEGDGLTNVQEYSNGTDPYSGDTDEDGFSDGYEISNGMDPLTFDKIVIDDDIISEYDDYTDYDLQILNINEPYPLEISLNDEGNVGLINGRFTEKSINNAQDALYSIYNVKTLLGIHDPASELKYDKSRINQYSDAYYFKVLHDGLELFGRTITIIVDKNGIPASIKSSYISDESLYSLDLQPEITYDELSEIINLNSEEPTGIINSELYITVENEPVLAYLVKTNSCEAIWVDAHSGEIISRKTTILDAYKGRGEDENGNTRSFPVAKYKKYYYLEDEKRNIAIYDCEGFSAKDRYENIGLSYQEDECDFIPFSSEKIDKWDNETAISAYCNIMGIYDWYNSAFKYKGLDGNGSFIPIFVNNETGKNAHYNSNPNCIIIDGNNSVENTYASNIGTLGHEYGHGVFNHYIGDYSDFEVSTIDEAYSDVFGSFLIYGNNQIEQWTIADRNIANPTSTHNPDHMDKKQSTVDSHLNSTIISHAAYLMTDEMHMNAIRVRNAFYNSLNWLDGSSDFNDVREAVLASAREMRYTEQEIKTIRKAFNEVGIMGYTGNAFVHVYESVYPVSDVKITLSSYGEELESKKTNSGGYARFDNLPIGEYEIKVEDYGLQPIYSKILVKPKINNSTEINILNSSTQYDWKYYDHYNFEEYNFGNRAYPTLEKHITKSNTDITMQGYNKYPLKDFLLTNENDNQSSFVHSSNKVLSFDICRDKADWHTMEGGGFLFDVSVRDQVESDPYSGYITAHCILVTSQGLKLYSLDDVEIKSFMDGKWTYIYEVGTQIGNTYYSIGDVLENHKLTIRIDKSTNEYISVWNNGEIVIDKLKINKLKGSDYGPITSHRSHNCSQRSFFTFSNIQMSSVTFK